jgi:hypothetical protein
MQRTGPVHQGEWVVQAFLGRKTLSSLTAKPSCSRANVTESVKMKVERRIHAEERLSPKRSPAPISSLPKQIA